MNFLPIKKLNAGSDTVKFPNALQGSQCSVLRFACQCWSALMTHDVTTKNKLAVFFICDLPTKESVPRSTRYLLGDFDGPWIP